MHHMFVDLQKAYDTVPSRKLWPSLEENRISQPYIIAVKNLYSKTSRAMKEGNNVFEKFPTTKGLKQGYHKYKALKHKLLNIK